MKHAFVTLTILGALFQVRAAKLLYAGTSAGIYKSADNGGEVVKL